MAANVFHAPHTALTATYWIRTQAQQHARYANTGTSCIWGSASTLALASTTCCRGTAISAHRTA